MWERERKIVGEKHTIREQQQLIKKKTDYKWTRIISTSNHTVLNTHTLVVKTQVTEIFFAYVPDK